MRLELIIYCILLQFSAFLALKRSATLDNERKFNVSWEVCDKTNVVTFELTVETNGYIGFGISSNGNMAGADIIIGGLNSDGIPYFEDRHGEGDVLPEIDLHKDWKLLESSENPGFTYLKFSRPISTCDDQDVTITADAQRFIWAIGQSDEIKYHDANHRGSYVVNILDPPIIETDLSKFKSFDLISNVTLPPKSTTYWCTLHESPNFNTMSHIIALGPKIDSVLSRKHSHHLSIYICRFPQGEDSNRLFKRLYVKGGQDCFGTEEDRSLEIYTYCYRLMYSWAMGARTMQLPENVGLPIGDKGRVYFFMEIHLDNPGAHPNINFEYGVKFHYTENLRPIDAGILNFGIDDDLEMVIPPKSSNFLVAAHCAPSCTNSIEPGGYTFFNVQLHAHTSSRKMRLRHFRNGIELPWIASDLTYDNHFQDNRNIRPVKFLPGDQLTLECTYDTNWINPPGAVIGGLSTRDEMCDSIIYYYPKGKLKSCSSDINGEKMFGLLGINSLSRTDGKNPKIESPMSLQGIRYLDYLDGHVNWTASLRASLEKELTIGPQNILCMLDEESEELDEKQFEDLRKANLNSGAYPKKFKVYKPKDVCSSASNVLFITQAWFYFPLFVHFLWHNFFN